MVLTQPDQWELGVIGCGAASVIAAAPVVNDRSKRPSEPFRIAKGEARDPKLSLSRALMV
jgi:hypothetical protein